MTKRSALTLTIGSLALAGAAFAFGMVTAVQRQAAPAKVVAVTAVTATPLPTATLSSFQYQALACQIQDTGSEIVSPITTTLTQTATFIVKVGGQCVPVRAVFDVDGTLLGSAQDGQAVACPTTNGEPWSAA